jgi:hypothetical protein
MGQEKRWVCNSGLVRALMAIVHEGATPDQASQHLKQE